MGGALKDPSAFLRELAITRRLKQVNIVTLQAAFRDEQNVYLVMQHLDGGNLLQALRRRAPLRDDLIFEWIFELLCAVAYLHHHRLCHRDIKCENILLEAKAQDHPIKLIDFGLAIHFEKNKAMTGVVGTLYSMAPELLSGRPYFETVDIWSSGCVAFELCTGHAPYVAKYNRNLITLIKTSEVCYGRTEWEKRSTSLQRLVQAMLNRNPNERRGAKYILQHNRRFCDRKAIVRNSDSCFQVQHCCNIS